MGIKSPQSTESRKKPHTPLGANTVNRQTTRKKSLHQQVLNFHFSYTIIFVSPESRWLASSSSIRDGTDSSKHALPRLHADETCCGTHAWHLPPSQTTLLGAGSPMTQASGDSASASHLVMRALGLQACVTMPGFTSVLKIPPQALFHGKHFSRRDTSPAHIPTFE